MQALAINITRVNFTEIPINRSLRPFASRFQLQMKASAVIMGLSRPEGREYVDVLGQISNKYQRVTPEWTSGGEKQMSVGFLVPYLPDDQIINITLGVFAECGGQFNTKGTEVYLRFTRNGTDWDIDSGTDINGDFSDYYDYCTTNQRECARIAVMDGGFLGAIASNPTIKGKFTFFRGIEFLPESLAAYFHPLTIETY